MAHVGKLMREQTRADAYEEKHQARIYAERRAHQTAAAQAIAEREIRFPVLTAENAGAAIEFQTRRIEEILRTL